MSTEHTSDLGSPSDKGHLPDQVRTRQEDKWIDLLQRRLGTFLIAAIVTVLTVFSNTLTERIKFGLDRADLRQSKFEKLSDNLSIYLFNSELLQEYLAEGLSPKSAYYETENELNDSITKLRIAEYSNRAMITHYWDSKRAQEFDEIMSDTKSLNLVFHELNQQNHDKLIESYTPELEGKVSADIKARLDPLKIKVQSFLLDLQ